MRRDFYGNEMIYIKEGYYVKTYDLCTGEIVISQINHVINKDKYISTWRGNDEFCYEDGKFIKIQPYTAIWDKEKYRFVFKLPRVEACFATIVVQACESLRPLLIDNEKVTYDFENLLYMLDDEDD
jgi:hypothetical protein